MNEKRLDHIDNYLSGRLSDEAVDAFEEQLLTDVVLQREVEEQIAFREALKKETTVLLSDPESGLFDQLARWLTSPAWAYTATAGLVLAVTVNLINSDSLTSGVLGSSAVIRNVEMTRSDADALLRVPADQFIVLSIDAFGLGVSEASLTLLDPSENTIAAIDMEADEQELFNVVIGPLSSGEYQLEITREDAEPVVSILIVE